MYFLQLLSISPAKAVAFLLAIVAAVAVHEFSHAWTAWKLGDPTPQLDGRVTLNPAAHLDPLGSLSFLLLNFGWGKPVVYNPHYLKRRSDELLIALAGPASNLVLAFLLNVLVFVMHGALPAFGDFLYQAAFVNVLLASFNLIPLPPLDGSSIIAYFWPEYRFLISGQIGLVVLIALIIIPVPGYGNILGLIIQPAGAFFNQITHLFGLI